MQMSSEPENAMTDYLWNSANILIMPISYCPLLNNFSILICILGLCITLVLYQEQHKLVNTGSAAGVSTMTPPPEFRH
jgi:hypothetical protein